VATNIFVPDSFGVFTGSYRLNPRAEAYSVYMKGADYSANYSDDATTTKSFTANIPEDDEAPVISLLTPADGATLANSTSRVIFTVSDTLGTVADEDVMLKLNNVDVSNALYKDASGRYNYDLVGGLDNGIHSLRITAADDSNNLSALNSSFTTSGQPAVTFTVTFAAGGAPAVGATVSITGTAKTATVGADGTVVLGLADGTYDYAVTLAGHRTATGTIVVYGDTNVPVVALTAVYDVTFTITMKDGTTPIAGATIVVTSGASTVGTLTTNGAGKATIALENGSYSYTVSKEGYAIPNAVSFTVAGEALPGLTVSLNKVVSCTVTAGQVKIDFKPYAALISSPSDRSVTVMYAIYEGKRMVGIATKTALLTANGINDSATIAFNTKYTPDTCKVFIMNDSYKPEVANFTETLN